MRLPAVTLGILVAIAMLGCDTAVEPYVPGEIASERPLRLVLDRRPFL